METVITNNATDSSQTGVSGEGCWDLWGYGVALCLSLACAISESKCSSFIYYSICFTPLFLFLFSHTPFSLSPLGGAVFIFGLLIFFPPSLSLRSWLVKSFHHRVIPLTGLWAEDTCMLFCTCVLWLIIDGSVFSYLLIYSSLNRLRPPPPRAQAVKIRWICNNACYVTKLDIQNRLLIVKTLDTGLRWIFCQSTNRFIIRSAAYCSMITKVVPIQIQISELRQILLKILESLPARTRVCAPI